MANVSSCSGNSSTFINNNDEIKSKEEELEQSTKEMKKLIENVEKELKDIRPSRSRYDIYHVSGQLFKQNPDAYRPHMVSIGPLYHGDEHLRITETDKLQYLNKLLKRFGKTFDSCVDALADLEEEARKRYSESEQKRFGKVQFAKTMVMDSCFILQFLDSWYTGANVHHFVSNHLWGIHILIDLIKLENQLPLFVLQHFYGQLFPQHCSFSHFIYDSLIQPIAQELNGSIRFSVGVEDLEKFIHADGGAKHFLDLLRRTLIASNESDSQLPYNAIELKSASATEGGAKHFLDLSICIPREKPSNEGDSNQAYNARELKSAGVKFQKRKNASNLFDINFDKEKGVLAIPTIVLSDHTEVILRNFIALEQEELGTRQYFTSYAAFMDELIDTTEDVTLLTQKGIIINGLGSPEDAATLFNKIVRQVVIWDTHFSGVTEDLSEHYNKSCNKRMANLRQTYFNSPWAGISVAAAALVIILTIIQTICSLLQF